ncbi:MAG: addiction module antitoxin [Chloroflexi bacterium]|nr:addiction module antitoxin [Chloroflexota bacterium]
MFCGALDEKKLTISIDAKVYERLHAIIGRDHVSRFIEELVRTYILQQGLEDAYEQLSQDEAREA